jgi:hypothetical protein
MIAGMPRCIGAIALIAAMVHAAAPIPASAAQTAAESDARHQRFRQTVGEVLETREFAELGGQPSNWLRRWFDSLARAIDRVVSATPEWVVWVLVIWMVGTLVAILLHLVWTLWVTMGGPGSRSSRSDEAEGPHEWLGVRDLRFESVLDRARRLRAEGRWAEAVRYAYVAGLLWLRDRRRITYHQSKTSRDFIREVSGDAQTRLLLSKMTAAFESVAYRGADATAADAAAVSESLDRLTHDARTT